VFPADPAADGILLWDDSQSQNEYAAIGSGLSYDGTTLTATAAGGDPNRLPTFSVTTTTTSPTTTSGGNAAGDAYIVIPAELNGYTVTTQIASVFTPTTSGTLTMNVRNFTDNVNVYSTAITIDNTEYNTTTAATPAVIANGSLATGDRLGVQVTDTGTGAKGLQVILTAEAP